MKNAKAYIILALLLLLLGISNCSNPTYNSKNQAPENYQVGKQFVSNNCLSCHSEIAPESERIAPPLFAVRQYYLADKPEKDAFVKEMLAFLQETNSSSAKMHTAVKKYGLMPQMSFPEEDLKKALAYLYDYEQELNKEIADSDNELDEMSEKLRYGKSLALQTKKALGKNLMNALAVGGSTYAVEFCHLNAIAITDSMENVLGVNIKRVSDLNRNSDNAASAEEQFIISRFKESLLKGETPEGEIKSTNYGYRGFYPIVTNQMCLQCHGSKAEDVSSETLNKIAAKYPNDLALGYKINELRGMWVVDMPNKTK